MTSRSLELPHGYVTVIDEADWPLVQGLKLYRGRNGYAYFSPWVDGQSKSRTLHGFLMQTPKGMHTDHINGDKLDNRRANLRVVTPSVNLMNRHGLASNNRSGATGVYFSAHCTTKPWRAQIVANGKHFGLGGFGTRDEAIEARRAAERDLFTKPT